MIREAYVSFATARLLKEKGFDVPCHSHFFESEHKTYVDILPTNWNVAKGCYSRPTQQIAMRWLREVHSLHINAFIVLNRNSLWDWGVYNATDGTPVLETLSLYDTNEEAVEAALEYCLTHLI